VEQEPFVPLTPDDEEGVFAVDELPLQLYAFATFGAVFKIKNNAVIEMKSKFNKELVKSTC